MHQFIGLIRGINVGGNNLLKMADLRQFLGEIGFSNAATLLQSGNFVLKSDEAFARVIEGMIKAEAKLRLGLTADFFILTRAEWQSLIEANPFPNAAATDPSHLLAYVQRQAPDRDRLDAIRKAYHGPEQFERVREILYVHFPDGIGISRLLANKDWRSITSMGTARNWNTVLKLAELADA